MRAVQWPVCRTDVCVCAPLFILFSNTDIASPTDGACLAGPVHSSSLCGAWCTGQEALAEGADLSVCLVKQVNWKLHNQHRSCLYYLTLYDIEEGLSEYSCILNS